ncbi:kexin precursor [Microthyrium microscopicum]|uniref:Kexin n=1 Tax=Microthyrium microscopicum TaxID=703497 RepID=A0A6A6UT58_9PEZI|nr:kexin precursor [Microthyrium microscopicum]
MRVPTILLALFGLASATSHISERSNRDYTTHDYYALHLDPSSSPHEVALHLGLDYDGQLDFLDDHHMFKAAKHPNDVVEESIQALKHRRKVKRDLSPSPLDSIKFNQKQVQRKRLFKRGIIPRPLAGLHDRDAVVLPETTNSLLERADVIKQLGITDPIFSAQWHLFNTKEVGNDMNVTGVWLQGITGKGATVCIVDDGLDMDSLDLKPNYFAKGSYDFNDGQDEPKPKLDDDQHGTRCAGEVAAAKNDVCGVGVAYDARISGVRILSAPISDVDEAASIVYGFQENDIYSCSWGPPDDGRTMDAPGLLIKKAILKAVQEGRGGKGTIYVFAAGNGAAAGDNCNFDGYTNSIYSVTIGAIDKTDAHPYYSEKCSAQLAVTYSSGAGEAIHTTDIGTNKCTNIHGGTSAAGPLVSGVFALVLSVRPDLSWRDIQWLTALTSVPFYKQEKESEWQTTATGRKFSHQYGYGKVDAWQIVELAKTWKNVKKQAWYFSPWIHVRTAIPEGSNGLSSTFEITPDMLRVANLERVEHVTVTMNVAHTRRGDISVELHSPTGIISHLSETRRFDEAPIGYIDWTFMTVAHFGETGIGKWTIIVKDSIENKNKGTFTDWRIKLWGESIDPAVQGMLPMPTENEDKDHDVDVTTGVIGTTSVQPKPTSNIIVTTGLPTRPSIVKPTDSPNASSTDSSTGSPTSVAQTPPSESQGESAGETNGKLDEAVPSPSPTGSSFLPSVFPTFGLSKRTQIWIYGALALILIFVASLGAYFFVQRRRRLRNNPRDNYEFAMLDDQEETDGMLASTTRRGRRRRAGELYDAFAGESDEDLFSDDDAEYRDESREHLPGTGFAGKGRPVNEKDDGAQSDDDEKGGLVR